MATSIAHLCEKNGYDPHEALGTSLLTLAISTFIVGVLIVLVGACRHQFDILKRHQLQNRVSCACLGSKDNLQHAQ